MFTDVTSDGDRQYALGLPIIAFRVDDFGRPAFLKDANARRW